MKESYSTHVELVYLLGRVYLQDGVHLLEERPNDALDAHRTIAADEVGRLGLLRHVHNVQVHA